MHNNYTANLGYNCNNSTDDLEIDVAAVLPYRPSNAI